LENLKKRIDDKDKNDEDKTKNQNKRKREDNFEELQERKKIKKLKKPQIKENICGALTKKGRICTHTKEKCPYKCHVKR